MRLEHACELIGKRIILARALWAASVASNHVIPRCQTWLPLTRQTTAPMTGGLQIKWNAYELLTISPVAKSILFLFALFAVNYLSVKSQS